MTTLDRAIIASYEKEGKRFELYVDPDSAYAFVEKKKPDVKNILVAEEIYADAKKGEKAKPSDIQKVFGTTDIMVILEFVLRHGEVIDDRAEAQEGGGEAQADTRHITT
jgi:ribosome maturation protein SDO1